MAEISFSGLKGVSNQKILRKNKPHGPGNQVDWRINEINIFGIKLDEPLQILFTNMKPEPWKPGPLMGHINYVSVESVGIRHNEHECHVGICKKKQIRL